MSLCSVFASHYPDKMIRFAAFLLLGLSAAPSAFAQSGEDILAFVDPLIGTVNGGHVFPGPTLPFGMAKAVADVNGEDQGGFASDNSNITGFSHVSSQVCSSCGVY